MGATETSPAQVGVVRRAFDSARDVGRTLASVFTNPDLRRIQLAFAGSVVGDWAYATAVTVWTYRSGGAAAVGVFQAVRFVAMTVAAPTGAVLADRFSRKAFMMTADAIRVVLVVLASICVALDLVPAVYVLALTAAVVGAPFRSAQAGLIPRLARTPEELTASNATASNLENLAVFIGPALGALMIAFLDVEVVFLFNAATFLVSFLLVSRINVPAAVPSKDEQGDDRDESERSEEPEPKESFLAEVSAGFRTIFTTRGVGSVAVLAGTQGAVWGALSVFFVVMSVELLQTGARGVGYLQSVMGMATVAGGAVVLARVSAKRTGQDMALGVLGWSLPLLAVAAWPTPAVLFSAVAVVGLSDPAVNLGLDTIPQRIVPDHVLSRVFGAMDATLVGAMSIGAVAAPVLLHELGLRPSLLLVGGSGALVAAVWLPRMRGLDRHLSAPDGLALLEPLPLFAPLGPATLESLAHALQTVRVPAGHAVVREGDVADKFFIIESGRVEVTQGDRFLRHEGPGEFFGEIGLLRDVPRTATVVAVEDTVCRTLDRRPFLDAVVGHQDARRAAEDIASLRLAV